MLSQRIRNRYYKTLGKISSPLSPLSLASTCINKLIPMKKNNLFSHQNILRELLMHSYLKITNFYVWMFIWWSTLLFIAYKLKIKLKMIITVRITWNLFHTFNAILPTTNHFDFMAFVCKALPSARAILILYFTNHFRTRLLHRWK